MDKKNFIINNINNIKSIRIIINDNYCEEGDLETIIFFNDGTKKSLFVSWDENGDYFFLSNEDNEEDRDEEYEIISNYDYACRAFKDKKISFEFPDMDEIHINKEIPKDFQERFDKKRYNNKWAIMRIYPNNNPVKARVIGVMINKIFYIVFIDIGGNLYKHD